MWSISKRKEKERWVQRSKIRSIIKLSKAIDKSKTAFTIKFLTKLLQRVS